MLKSISSNLHATGLITSIASAPGIATASVGTGIAAAVPAVAAASASIGIPRGITAYQRVSRAYR